MEPLLVLVLIAVVYLGSCAVHPYLRCTACNRSKETSSVVFKRAFGPCRNCRGRGHTLRFGARVLGRKI